MRQHFLSQTEFDTLLKLNITGLFLNLLHKVLQLKSKWRKCTLFYPEAALTHWGWVTHICVSKLTSIGSDNGLSPGRRQAIIWTNAAILLIGPLRTNFSEILIAIETFSFKKMHLKISSAKWRPFCLGLNVLKLTNFGFCFYNISPSRERQRPFK